MRRARVIRLLLVLPLAFGASAVGPATVSAGVDDPPPAFINGVAGDPFSWCIGGGCVDAVGLPDPSSLPLVSEPLELELPSGAELGEVKSWASSRRTAQPIPVPFKDTSIGPVPQSAVMLFVSVNFAEGGGASYFWALDVAAHEGASMVPDTALNAP